MEIDEAIEEFIIWIDSNYKPKNIPSKEALLKAYAGLEIFKNMTTNTSETMSATK